MAGDSQAVLDALGALRADVGDLRRDVGDVLREHGERLAALEATTPGVRLAALEARTQRTLGRDAALAGVGAALATLAGLALSWAS